MGDPDIYCGKVAALVVQLLAVEYGCLPRSLHSIAYFGMVFVERGISGPPSCDRIHATAGPHKGAAGAVGDAVRTWGPRRRRRRTYIPSLRT